MASPVCTVNSTTTGNGVNVAKNSSVTIQLFDTAGVNVWSIRCLTTDDLQVADTITASLGINSITKTATFTSPNVTNGAALIFESKVNGGLDANGRNDASLTTRFGVFVLTDLGNLRVGAFDETVEGNAAFGWTAKFNAGIRQAAASSATPTVSGTLPIVIDATNPLALVASINAATTSLPGTMSAADKVKLDSVIAGASVVLVAGTAPITITGSQSYPVVNISAATTSLPGSMSAADKTKINTLRPAAPAGPITFTDVFGTDFININPASGAAAGSMSSADKTKLDNATASATADTLVLRNGSGGCSVAAFGATLVTASTGFVGPYFSMSGSFVAGSGLLRGNSGQTLIATRNDGDSVDVSCMSWGVENTDALGIGDGGNTASVYVNTSSTGFVYLNTSNLALFANSDFGSGVGVVYIKNAHTVPTTNPTDGVYVYAEGGALKCRGSSGTITTLAPA